MIDQFIDHISHFISLTEKEAEAISSQIHVKNYAAGDILLREGMISKLSYFNLKGCVRLYYLLDGEEKTTHFYTENQFITSIRSFTTGIPADHYLACVEDCTLVLLPFEVERTLLKEFPGLETFSRIILEQELANYQEMLSAQIMLNPEQRYLNLMKKNPELMQRVPLYQLASFIGVTPESLSRIRKRISQKTSYL